MLFVSDETSPLINTRSTTFDGTRFNLHAGSFQSRELLMRHDRVGEAGKTVACFIGS